MEARTTGAKRFEGRKVLVTGAASGIGKATAILFAGEGASVIAADRDEAGLADTIGEMGEGHRSVRFDAMDTQSCHALVAEAASDGLDIVCNIAGVLDWGATEKFDEERFDRIIGVNLRATFAICRAALPRLLESRGNIVNMASSSGLIGVPYSVAYSASKHGVVGLTKSIAAEFAGRGVRVNAVCPGHVDTPMTATPPPLDEIDWDLVMRAAPKLANGTCDPVDIAKAVAYLASEDAAKITGTALVIDGGQLAA